MLDLNTINICLHEMWKDHQGIIGLIIAAITALILYLGAKSNPYLIIAVLSVVILLFLIVFYLIFYLCKFVPIQISSQEFIFNPQLAQGMVRFPSPVLLFNPQYKSHYKFSLKLLEGEYKNLIKWKRYVLVLEKPKKTFEVTPTETQDSLNPIFHYNDEYCFLEQEFEGGGKKELNFSFEIGSNEDAKGKYSISIYLIKEINYNEIFEDNFRDNFKAKLIHEENAHRIDITRADLKDPIEEMSKIQKMISEEQF